MERPAQSAPEVRPEAVLAPAPQPAPPQRPVALPDPVGAARRVQEIVQRLEDQPPPRSLTLELPELGGLRVRVSLQGVSTVRVAVVDGHLQPEQQQLFNREMRGALESRGFELAQSFQHRQRQRTAHEEPLWRWADGGRHQRRRAASTGLRI